MDSIPLVDPNPPLDLDSSLELAPILDPDPAIPIPGLIAVISIPIPIPAKNGIRTALLWTSHASVVHAT